jgi:hypothetical protein
LLSGSNRQDAVNFRPACVAISGEVDTGDSEVDAVSGGLTWIQVAASSAEG